jgi:hypothetical protein
MTFGLSEGIRIMIGHHYTQSTTGDNCHMKVSGMHLSAGTRKWCIPWLSQLETAGVSRDLYGTTQSIVWNLTYKNS